MSHSELVEFSVIIPVFNAENTIEACLKSVISGRYKPKQILIYNDASTDDTRKILEKLCQSYPNIHCIHGEKNKGAGNARNTLLKAVSSRYIAFIDADDIWHEDYLLTYSKVIIAHDPDIITGSYNIANENSEIIGSRIPLKKITKFSMYFTNWLPTSFTVVRASLIGARDMPLIRRRQDYAYWLKLFQVNKNLKTYTVTQPMGTYTRRSGSLSSNKLENLVWNYNLFRNTMRYSVVSSLVCIMFNVIIRLSRK